MICSGQHSNGAVQQRLARSGFARATVAVLSLVIGGFAAESAWAAPAAAIVSNAGTDNTYKVGDDIDIDVTFDNVVYVQEDQDGLKLELILGIGENYRRATFVDGSGSSDMKLHFRYTVQSGDEDDDGVSIANGSTSLVGGIITLGAGTVVTDRSYPAVQASPSHKVDGIIPTVTAGGVTITSTPKPDSDNTYSLAEPILVSVTFDEIVHVDETVSELVLVLSIGQHSRQATFVGGSGSTILRFSYTVQRGDEDDDGISIGSGPASLQGATVADFAGNPVDRTFAAVGAQSGHKVDGVTPSLNAARITSTPESGDTYGLNEEIRIAVDFGEEVHATDPEGDLELILSIGQHSRSAKLADGSGTTTLTFAYVVQSDDEDEDGISIGPTALQGGILEDAAGNPVDRTFGGRMADGNHKVDGVSPSLRAMRIVSSPAAAGVYGLNETIMVDVDFNEEVHVDETETELVLVLAIGQHSRPATFVEGSGTATLKFSYAVQSDDRDDDGISIGPGISATEGSLTGAGVHDKAGNVVDRTFVGVGAQSGHKVDGMTTPQAAVQIVSTPAASGTYGLNEEIRVQINFGEAVYVTGTVTLALDIGANERQASYAGGSGTDTLEFRYVVRSNDKDDDGISIGSDALDGGTIEDGDGNAVNRAITRLAPDSSHKVDGTSASLSGVRIVSTPDSGSTYGLDEEIRVAVDFGRVVHVTNPDQAPTLRISIGENLRDASLASGSGTATLTFRYVVQSDDYDDDGISIGANALRGGGIEDAGGNPVVRTFAGLAADSRHRVDGLAPVLDRVSIVSSPDHDRTYGVNEEIRIEVDFDEEVHVKDEVVIDVTIGEHTRQATFVTGSGTETLTFRYVVQSDDYDDDGISIPPDCLRGIVRDAAGNPVDGEARSYRGLASDSRHKVDGINTSRPRVHVVSPRGHDGKYGLNEEIRAAVDFPAEVHVTGDPTLTLSIGEHSRRAALANGSGTKRLTFRYVVQSDDYDDDGISIGPNALQGGAIEDAAGNAVNRSFAALGADDDHKVDGVRPALRRVEIKSRPDESGFYGMDDEITIDVTFGEVVHVDDAVGAVTLVLSIGENSRPATFVGGSGTDTLTFRYVVQSDDYDDDGISIGPNALRGGVIEDSAGNLVDRTSAGMSAASRHKVDGTITVRLVVRIVSEPDSGGTYGLNEEIRVDVEFGQDVYVSGELSMVLSIGEHQRVATLANGSGTPTLTFRYVVQSDDDDDDGISIGANALQGGRIEDGTGNVVERMVAALAADVNHKVDGVSPAVVRVTIVSTPDADDTYGVDEAINVAVYFGEEVHVTEDGGALALVLSIGEHLRSATLAGGSGTDTLTFRYVIRENDADEDGISIGPNALQGGAIEDAAGNTVNRTFAGLATDADHKVDGVRPVLTRVEIQSTPGESGFYGMDDGITVEVAFGEVVHVDNATGAVTLILSIGEYSRAATFTGGSGTDTLTFRYVVQEDDYDDDGISIGPNALRGGVIEDAAGNPVERTFPGLEADGGQTVDGRVDRVIPAILTVAITSDAGSNDTYTTDDIITVEVEFNVAAYVTGAAPVLELSIGPALRQAVFVEGSGTHTLKFEYTVEAGDTDTDGISIAANALSGGITDANGNAIDLTFEAVPASASHRVSAELLLFPLSLTLEVGQSHTLDLLQELKRLGVAYVGDFEWSSDDETVATAALSGSMLTITSVSEGSARITVSATGAAIFLFFGVTVETSAAETAVLEGAMAAVGRGLLASAESTIGARLEMADSNPPDIWGGLGMSPSSAAVAARAQWSMLDAAHQWGSPISYGQVGVDDPYLQRSMGYTPAQLLRGRWFEMPFGGYGNSIDSWAVWGAGDWHAFEGSPEGGAYDGSIASVYLGLDARGHGWVAGATISRSLAEASYEFAGTVGGKGRLETELDVIHPYVQWAFGDRGKAWAILGLGTGEATAEREDQAAAEPSGLSMHMGLGGLRYSFGRVAWFDLAFRGDAGYAQLETEEGPLAIEGLTVNVQRVRLGVEASLPMSFAGIRVSPFLDVAGRFDGGDGETGGGVELAGGFRYRGPSVGLEVKGRTLAMHSAESYSEEGLKATLVVGPDGRKGFRLMLAPRWGGAAEAMDIFGYRGHPFGGALRRENRGWGLGTRISYGFDMWRRPGTVMPFAEMDLSGDVSRRARLGVSYEIASAVLGLPHRLEISGEGTESELHGTIMRFLLTGQAHF